MSTAAQQLARFLEECAWLLRDRPWAQLKEIAWGCFSAFLIQAWIIDKVFGISELLALNVLGLLLWALDCYARRKLPFSDRLRARWQIEKELHRRFESYKFKKLFWQGLGMVCGLMLLGAPFVYLPAIHFLWGIGLVAQLLWQRTGIDEQNYQPA